MTNYDKIKKSEIEDVARLLSILAWATEYDEGDWDPTIMKWLEEDWDE